MKHISPVPSNYREMKITGSSRHQEGCWSPWLQGRQFVPLRGQKRITERKWGLWRRGGRNQNWGESMRSGGEGAEVETGGAHWGERKFGLLRASACLLYKCIIFLQRAHLLLHSFQVRDLILNTGSGKRVPVNSEAWFSPLWRHQEEVSRGEGQGYKAWTERARQSTGYLTPFNTHPLSTSILHLGLCSCWQGVNMCPWPPGQRSNLYNKIL